MLRRLGVVYEEKGKILFRKSENIIIRQGTQSDIQREKQDATDYELLPLTTKWYFKGVYRITGCIQGTRRSGRSIF